LRTGFGAVAIANEEALAGGGRCGGGAHLAAGPFRPGGSGRLGQVRR
jgi:hypothetical protein